MRTPPALLLASAVGSLVLAACGADAGGSGSDAAGVSVVAAAYPFQFVAERVGGGLVSVTNLTGPGVEPHDAELTPQQIAQISDADLVIYEETFQPAVDDAIEQSGLEDDQLLDVTSVVPLQETGAVHAEEGHEDHSHEEDVHEEDAHEEDAHEEEHALDPHVWLDPHLMMQIADAAADQLAETDPDNAAAYHGNADQLIRELESLDKDFKGALSDCQRTTVVTSHDAFRYLAARYGLEMVPIAGVDPTQEPAPAQQAEIADTVEAEGVTTIFTEELVSPAVAESIADETGASIAILSPIEGLSDETADEDYLSLMRQNLEALREANGCA
jgi:zinc transport system substrate-binding protein